MSEDNKSVELKDEQLNKVSGGQGLFATTKLNGNINKFSVYKQDHSRFFWAYDNEGSDRVKYVLKFYAYGYWDKKATEGTMLGTTMAKFEKLSVSYTSKEDFINNFNPY